MSVYTDLIETAKNGGRFKVDLMDKSLWIGRKQIIKEKVYEQDKSKDLIEEYDLCEFGMGIPLKENPWEVVDELYAIYYNSVPGKNAGKKYYFKALPVDQLSTAEIAYNPDRDYAYAILAGYILLGSLQGWLTWQYGDYWYWRSENNDNFVILRNWIE